MRKLFILTALATVVGLLITLGGNQAEATHVSCGDSLTTNTTLDSDLTCAAGPGLIIGADNIKLNCAGHTITGPSGGGTGIDVTGRTGVTIKNCHVTSFSNNFVLLDSSDNTLKWNTSTANTSVAGFWLKGTSSNNTLKNNTANGGVKFGTSNGFVVQASASGNILTHNTANGNAFRGISIVGSGNIIRNNTANGNFTAGFLMFGGSGNTFTANTATNNDSEGFAILSASGNTFTGNVANDNGTLHSSSGSSWPVPLETPSRGTRPTEMTPSATWTFRRVLVRRERPTPIVGTCVKGTKSEAQARPGCASHNRKLPVVRTSTEMGRGLGRAAQLAAISWHRPGAGNGVGGRKQRVGPQFKMMLEETLEGEARL